MFFIFCKTFILFTTIWSVCSYHVTYVVRVNLHSVIARMSRNSLLETDMISEVLSCCNRTPNNHLVCDRKLNDLAKLDCLARLTKWLSVYLQTKWLWAQVSLQPPTTSLLVSLFFRKILIHFMSFFEAFLFFWIIFS